MATHEWVKPKSLINGYSIASKFSICRSRNTTTQEFYNNLPAFIAAEIAGTLKSLHGNNALRPTY